MAATEGDRRPVSAAVTWRTPLVIVVCGCLIGMLTFGPRSTFGFFLQPMSREFAWGRVVFGLALDFVDALDIEGGVAGLGPDRRRGLFRNDAEFRLRIRRMGLDLEPDLEARLRLPDGGHFRTGVARNHRRL